LYAAKQYIVLLDVDFTWYRFYSTVFVITMLMTLFLLHALRL